MSWLGAWLVAVGVMDLARVIMPRPARREVLLLGAVALLGIALLGGLYGVGDAIALVISLVPLAGWWWFADRSLAPAGPRAPAAALLSLGGGVVGLIAFGGFASSVGGPLGTWLTWAQPPLIAGQSPGRVLLVLGLLVANLATGNVVVRLVLIAVGALRPGTAGPQPADRLRGGRLLGPMERLVILGLGLSGQLTAASIVIAAKGLLRFPELQSASRDGTSGVSGVGIDEVTEYFLVGSFVSWILALGSLALTR